MMFIQQLKDRKNMWKWLFACSLSSWGPHFENGLYQNYSQDPHQFEMTNAPCPYENCGPYSHQNKLQNWGYYDKQQSPQQLLCLWWASCSHESHESSSQPVYHADSDDDVNSHSAAYYADQQISEDHEYKDHIHEHVYANRAFSKHAYSCWICEKIFLLVSQLKYHIIETHYNYLVFIYNAAVTSINYIKMQTSIDKLSTKSRVICLDSEVIHMLVNCSLIANHIHLVSETLEIHDVARVSELSFFKHVNIHLYIHSNNSKSKVFVVCKTYMVNKLDADMLINMNVMQLEGMVLDCEKDKLIMNSHYDFTTFFSRFMKENNLKWVNVYHFKIISKTAMWCSDEFTLETALENTINWVISHVEMHIKSMMNLHTNLMSTNSHSCVCCIGIKIFQLSTSLHKHLCISDYVTSHCSQQSWWSWHTDRLWRKIVDREIIMGKTTWDILMQKIMTWKLSRKCGHHLAPY